MEIINLLEINGIIKRLQTIKRIIITSMWVMNLILISIVTLPIIIQEDIISTKIQINSSSNQIMVKTNII